MSDSITEETASTLSAIAEGSLGRARMLHKEELLDLRREIVQQLITLAPGQPDTVETVFALAQKAADIKDHLEELLDLLTIWIRDIMLAQNGLSAKIISHDLHELLPTARRRWSASVLAEKLHLIDKARRQLLHNCNRTLVCEVLFFGLL